MTTEPGRRSSPGKHAMGEAEDAVEDDPEGVDRITSLAADNAHAG